MSTELVQSSQRGAAPLAVIEHHLKGDGVAQEFLAFTLGGEVYGIDILKVQDIRGYEVVTRIANTPNFI